MLKDSILSIQSRVANHYGITISDIMSYKKAPYFSNPRQVAMYISRQLLGISYPKIAMRFGKKNHTTIVYAVKKVTQIRECDKELNDFIKGFGI